MDARNKSHSHPNRWSIAWHCLPLRYKIRIETNVGRERELKVLDDLWQSSHPEFLILYGRRRVGKTQLLKTWAERSGARVFYWVADPTSSFDQLRSFSQALYNFGEPRTPAAEDFHYASWRQAFEVMAELGQGQALDEIRCRLLDFIGAHTWAELCREWLLKASALKRLPFEADQVGSAWTRQAQVDVAGINCMEKTLYLGECK